MMEKEYHMVQLMAYAVPCSATESQSMVDVEPMIEGMGAAVCFVPLARWFFFNKKNPIIFKLYSR